jgi:hypothetical protein
MKPTTAARRLLVTLADASPAFVAPAQPADGSFFRRLLIAMSDSAPAFQREAFVPRARFESAHSAIPRRDSLPSGVRPFGRREATGDILESLAPDAVINKPAAGNSPSRSPGRLPAFQQHGRPAMAGADGLAGPDGTPRRRKRGLLSPGFLVPVTVSLVLLISGGVYLALSEHASPSRGAGTPTVSALPIGPAAPPGQTRQPAPTSGHLRSQGRLTLQPGQAADLDSLVQENWNAGYGPWTAANGYNIGYDGSSLALKGGTGSWAAMGTAGNWNYNSCRYGAPYGQTASPSGNVIAAGHGICYLTSRGNQALLVVQNQSSSSITLTVTIWQD